MALPNSELDPEFCKQMMESLLDNPVPLVSGELLPTPEVFIFRMHPAVQGEAAIYRSTSDASEKPCASG